MESQTNSAISSQLFSDPNYDWDKAVIDALDSSFAESQHKAIEKTLETDMEKMDFIRLLPRKMVNCMESEEIQTMSLVLQIN